MDENKKQTLMTTLKQIEKQFGKGAVMRLGDVGAVLDVETISTGSLGLDIALGIGGLPRGRVVEIYGPEASGKTTLTLQVTAEIQKKGGVAAFIDAEHALDSQYAAKLGVDVGELLLSQPGSGEEALEIADIFVRSGTVDLVVVDSVAALVPKAEIEGEMGDSHMGLHARLMSQALRKLTANIKRSNTLVIFINQIRMKIGVMWGCFHYDSRVMLVDGASEKIGDIVKHRLPVEVLSYNAVTQAFEKRPVVAWYDNGETETFLQFQVATQEGSQYHQFLCTPNHRLLTPQGYRAAGEMQTGDKLITCENFYLSPTLEQIVWGSLLGNYVPKADSQATEYALWKQSLLLNKVNYYSNRDHLNTVSQLTFTTVLEESYPYEKSLLRPLSYPLIDRLEPLAIAIWYMDSGIFNDQAPYRCVINCKGMPEERRMALVQWFKKYSIVPHLNPQGDLDFSGHELFKFHDMIAPYVHPTMAYKLLPSLRKRFVPIKLETKKVRRAVAMPILAIRSLATAKKHRFDLEIEHNHNYIVEGVVVHNSPETTTGGNALKFYASVRLDIRRIGAIKQGEEVIGNETKVKIVKNKLAPPLREVTFDIIYGEGISRLSELIDLGVKHDFIEKAGTWYSYQGERLGQGKESVRKYLKEHPEVAETIEKQIRDRLLVKSPELANTKTESNTTDSKKKSDNK